MDLDLGGKIVLITGGSKGIGLACARGFKNEGAIVIIASRNPANLQQAVKDLDGAPGQIEPVEVDLTDADATAVMVGQIEKKYGRIDVLVNSAGAAQRKSLDELNPKSWRAAMDAKYFTYIHAIDAVIRGMMQRRSGTIVNIIGMGGKIARTTHLAGGAANAALMLVSNGLATACAGHGIRVNAINPGPTLTDRIGATMEGQARRTGLSVAETTRQAAQSIPMGRFGEPEEIANVALFLASPRASYVSGAQITMDGASTPTVI